MDNQVQRGSTFRVLLDLPYAKEAQIETNENTHEVTTLPDREITLLAAEDNDLNYEILREQLRMQGIRCVRAINGKECLEIFRDSVEHEYDAILMDMQMPVMNGLEAARAIRKLNHPEARSIHDHSTDSQCISGRYGSLYGGRHESSTWRSRYALRK